MSVRLQSGLNYPVGKQFGKQGSDARDTKFRNPVWRVHSESDPDLGTPLYPDCYDFEGQVAFNWYAPKLWRRFTITLGFLG